MAGFFSFFPSMVYANTVATNLIAKVQFDQSVSKRSANFYPYTIQANERADHIAETYYGDVALDWVIYLSNGITDPLNEWPKSENEFNSFLNLKYGSVANAQLQTAYYQVNYMNDDSVLSPSSYNALSTGQQKYWTPITGYNNTIINYERKRLDAVTDTNKVVQLTGSFGGFNENDLIKQSSTIVGTVGFANSSTIVIKHVSGTWSTGSIYYWGTGLVANATITSVSTINQSIPSNELSYWSPVTVYEQESLINESRKHINLLNSAYIDVIQRDMKDLL